MKFLSCEEIGAVSGGDVGVEYFFSMEEELDGRKCLSVLFLFTGDDQEEILDAVSQVFV